MTRHTLLIVLALVVALPAATRGQNSPSFGGTWKLSQAEPPVAAGRTHSSVTTSTRSVWKRSGPAERALLREVRGSPACIGFTSRTAP